MTTNLTDAIKEKLKDYVIQALPNGFVSTDWNIDISLLREHRRPICTIKLEPIKWTDPTYGCLVPMDGAVAEIHFSIYVFDDKDFKQAGEHPADWAAQDDAELIMDKLLSKGYNLTERAANYIIRIWNIHIKEPSSDEKNRTRQRSMSSYIVTGQIDATFVA